MMDCWNAEREMPPLQSESAGVSLSPSQSAGTNEHIVGSYSVLQRDYVSTQSRTRHSLGMVDNTSGADPKASIQNIAPATMPGVIHVSTASSNQAKNDTTEVVLHLN